MASNYNLIIENCITVELPSGEKVDMSVPDVLKEAHHIKDIVVERGCKIDTFALCKFIVVLASDIFRPANVEDICELFEKESFDAEQIDRYFEAYHDRFDLFDKSHPFLQVPVEEFKKKELLSISYLDPALMSGSNDVFYEPHPPKNGVHIMTAKETVPMLCRMAMCHVRTGSGYKSSIIGKSGQTPLFCLFTGNNLFETIIYNMCTVNKDDIPEWRRENFGEIRDPSVVNYSFFSILKINLVIDETDGLIKYMYMEPGVTLADSLKNDLRQNVASKDINIIMDDKQPIMASTNREPWMEISTMCQNRVSDSIQKQNKLFEALQDLDELPKKIKLKFYGLQKRTPPYKDIYFATPFLFADIMTDKVIQKKISLYTDYVLNVRYKMKMNLINYIEAMELRLCSKIDNQPYLPDSANYVLDEFMEDARFYFFNALLPEIYTLSIKDILTETAEMAVERYRDMYAIKGDRIAFFEYQRKFEEAIFGIKKKILGKEAKKKNET